MSEDCPFCLYEKTEENCPGCFEGSNYRPKPQTNADQIRAMSDEELARWIADDLIEPGYYDGDMCYRLWLDWLKSPVKNGP